MLSKLIGLAIAITMIAIVTTAHAARPLTQEANASVQYIESLQNDDGGFPAFGAESSPGSTIDAIFALKAAGVDPTTVTSAGNSPIDYLATQASTYAGSAAGAAKLQLALALAINNPLGLAPDVFIDTTARNYDRETGRFGDDIFAESFHILLFADSFGDIGAPVATLGAAYATSLQQPDGGWEFAAGQGSDSNSTALVIQALLAARTPRESQAVQRGLDYLYSVQNPDGAFGFLAGADSDPNSTALVIQALVAAGEDIDDGGPWDRGGHTPLDALLSFQNAATGAFQYAGEDSPYATYQAVPALMLAPFPQFESVGDGEPVSTGTPSAVPDLVPPATSTPMIVLPPAGSGPSGEAFEWALVAGVCAAGGGAIALGGLTARRRA